MVLEALRYFGKNGGNKSYSFRVENFKPVPIHHSKYGQFYSGDSYVIVYTYIVDKQSQTIIYFWQGSNSTTDERGASALIAKVNKYIALFCNKERIFMMRGEGHRFKSG